MYFMLEQKQMKRGYTSQMGIVVAESIEEAAAKIQVPIVEVITPPESAVVLAELQDDYWLVEFKEITSLPSPESIVERKTLLERIENWIEWKIFDHLLNQLNKGRHEYVHRFADYWGTKPGRWSKPFYNASALIQTGLISQFGYRECPECHWAVKSLEEHPQCSSDPWWNKSFEEQDE